MSTHMKRTLIVITIVVFAALGAFVLKLGADADNLRDTRAERRAILAQKLEARHLALRADDERLSQHPFFAPSGEGDAGPYLLKRLPWVPAEPGTVPALTADEFETFQGKANAWLTQESHPFVAGTDLTWFADLAQFAYWDWDALDGPRRGVTFPDVDGPIPNVVHLIALAKVRLLQALKSGDVALAVRDVRHLARLLYSSEHLLGAFGAVAILRSERAAVDEALRRGLAVDEVTEVFVNADLEVFKALLLASTAAFALDPTHQAHAQTVAIGRCTGLNEALMVAIPMRAFLNDRYAARYAELETQVERSGCRLSLTRRALTTSTGQNSKLIDASLCMAFLPGDLGKKATVAKSCEWGWTIRALPQVRAFLGESLLTAFDDLQFVRFLEGRRELDVTPSTNDDDNRPAAE